MSLATTKNRSGYVILFGTAVVIAVVVGFVGWQRGWLLGGPKYATPALSPSYLPSDTAAVLHVNLRELRDSKGVNKEMGPALRNLLNLLATGDLRQSLAVDPEQDIDWMQLTLHPGDANHPVDMTLLMAGNFDPAKFKVDPKGLRQINKPGDRYRLYELPDERLPHPLTLTPGDHVVLLSDRPVRVAKALAETEEGKSPELEDAALAELLRTVDRKQTIWGIASLKKLEQAGPLPPFSNTILESYLRPILDKTDVVYGGIVCGNEINGTVHFQTDSEENALLLEAYLKEKCIEARAFYGTAKLFNVKNDYVPLLQLVSTGKVTRDGHTVTLHCHLP